jgi:hypothetical protein
MFCEKNVVLWNVEAGRTCIYPWVLSGLVRMSSDRHDINLAEYKFVEITFVIKTNNFATYLLAIGILIIINIPIANK